MKFRLELIYDDGRREQPLADLPGEYFADHWAEVFGVITRRGLTPQVRLISDGGHVLSPVMSDEGRGAVAWWRVGEGETRLDLRSALARCRRSADGR